MQLELFNDEKHYKIISEWWKKQNWPILPLDALSSTGFIAHKDNTPIAAGFIYDTDSSFAIIEWVVGNPDVDHELRAEGLDSVLEGLVLIAKSRNKRFIHTIVEHKRLIERYKKFEFQTTDTDMTVMIRSL